MLWTMALKDHIAGMTNNTSVTVAIRTFGHNFPNYQNQPMYALHTLSVARR
jgi:hypothetical protein